MKKIHHAGLAAAVVFAVVVASGAGRATADEGVGIQSGSMTVNLLDGISRVENGKAPISRFNAPVEHPAVGRVYNLEDYQHKTSFCEVKDSFSNFVGSLGSFMGDIFSFLTQKRLLVPAIFLLMGVRALFRK